MLHIGIGTKWHHGILLASVLLFTSSPVAADGGCVPDEAVETLTVPGRWRGFGTDAAQWLRFEVASPAVLTLDATTPLTSPGEPALLVFGPGCRIRDEGFVYLERTSARQVLSVRTPGEFFVRVMAADPQHPLGFYKVTLDVGEPRQADPFSKDTEEIEIDPDGLGTGTGNPPGLGAPACGRKDDDHGDTASCATPLASGHRTAGSLGNPWGDDADVFELLLDEPAIVRIQAHSGTDTVGGLFDGDGHRLAVDDDSGDGKDFQIVRALVPGRYFLRIEGPDVAEQPYTVSLETRDW